MVLYLLILLGALAVSVDAGPVRMYQVHTFSPDTMPELAVDAGLVKVIGAINDTDWLRVDIGSGHRTSNPWGGAYIDEPDKLGAIHGFLIKYDRIPIYGGYSPKKWAMNSMQLGPGTLPKELADRPQEVPTCQFGEVSLEHREMVACMYKRNRNDRRIIDRVKKDYPHTPIFKSESDYRHFP